MKSILTSILFVVWNTVGYQLTPLSSDDSEGICISIITLEIRFVNHCLGLGHETMGHITYVLLCSYIIFPQTFTVILHGSQLWTSCHQSSLSGPLFTKKTPSFEYPLYQPKTVWRPSQVYNRIPYDNKTASSWWIEALLLVMARLLRVRNSIHLLFCRCLAQCITHRIIWDRVTSRLLYHIPR